MSIFHELFLNNDEKKSKSYQDIIKEKDKNKYNFNKSNIQKDINDIKAQREKFKQLNNKYKQAIEPRSIESKPVRRYFGDKQQSGTEPSNPLKSRSKIREAAEYILAV